MIEDFHVREKAMNPRESFIVQAPAGSGKTELLMQRILTLLLTVNEPEEVMALTFTKKAVEEMRTRVLTALQEANSPENLKSDHEKKSRALAQAVLEHDRKNQWHLLQSPHRLNISTIDALSLKICQGSFKQTLLPLDISPLDNSWDLYKNAIRQTFNDDKDNHLTHELQTLLLHCDNQFQTIERLLCQLIAQREQWLPLVMPYYHEPLRLKKACEEVSAAIAAFHLNKVIEHMPTSCIEPLWQSLIFSKQQCNENNTNYSDNCLLDNNPENINAWLDAANLLITKEGEWRSPRSINKTLGFSSDYPEEKKACQAILTMLCELDHQESLRESLSDLRECPSLQYQEESWNILKACLLCLPDIVAQCHLLFQSSGQCDYIELTLAACRVLDEEAFSQKALILNHQISHILIDECQDTSLSQAKLLTLLTQHWEIGDHKTLFLVGDPMQSIYRFRQAEVSLFHHWQTHGFGPVALTKLQLISNFRSQKNIVDWFNHQFMRIFPNQYSAQNGAIPYAPSTAVKENTYDDPVKAFIIREGDENDEARMIIETIKNNKNKSIAILLQKKSQALAIIKALDAHSIDYEASDIAPLISHPLTLDWLTCTRALCHFNDRIAWIALLRSPVCGATLELLFKINQHCKNKTLLSIFIDPDFETTYKDHLELLHFKQRLDYLLKNSKNLPLWQTIRLAWTILGFEDYYHRQADQVIFEQCQETLKNLKWHRHEFDREALNEMLEKTFCNASKNAHVKIMTIHKSKGLEFDVVIIPGLQFKSRSEDKALITWQTLIFDDHAPQFCIAPLASKEQKNEMLYDYCRMIEQKKLQEERKRLLYVACTRAKNQLYVLATLAQQKDSPWICEQFHPNKVSFASMLWPFMCEHAQIIEAHQNAPTLATLQTQLTQPKQAWLENKLLSFDFNQKTYASQLSNHNRVNLNLDHLKNQTKAQNLGDALHALCEKIPLHGLYFNYEPIIVFIAHRFQTMLEPKKNIIEMLRQALNTMQNDKKAQWIFTAHENAHSEWVIVEKKNFEVKKHIIDRSFIDQNARWIIDFKSTSPSQNQSTIHFLENQKNQYQKQLQRYANCLNLLGEKLPIMGALYFPLCGLWIQVEFDLATKPNK